MAVMPSHSIAVMRSNASEVTSAEGDAEHHRSGARLWPCPRAVSMKPAIGRLMPATASISGQPRTSPGQPSACANAA